MSNLSSRCIPVNPGCPDRGASTRAGAGDPHRLDGADRRAWEESVKGRPGLKGSRTLVLLVLLDIARGKPHGYPSDAYIAGKCGVSENTVWRCLRDLAGLGIIHTVRARGRRWIVFLDHPHAAASLAGLGASAPADPGPAPSPVPQAGIPGPQVGAAVPQIGIPGPQVGGLSVLVESGDETRHEPAPAREAGPGLFLSGPNERTTEGEAPPPRPTSSPPPSSGVRRGLRGLPDLAGAPADDPIIAAELARRARAREAAPVHDRDAIIAAALGDAIPVPEVAPTPEACRGAGAGVHDAAPAVDPEAATIEALSRLGPGATRGEVLAATLRLTALFRDPTSRAFYRSVCNDVARGQLPARVPIAAVGSARGPGVRRPGATFTAHIKRAKAAATARQLRAAGP